MKVLAGNSRIQHIFFEEQLDQELCTLKCAENFLYYQILAKEILSEIVSNERLVLLNKLQNFPSPFTVLILLKYLKNRVSTEGSRFWESLEEHLFLCKGLKSSGIESGTE